MQIKDRTFIISGASSGLGLATALMLLQHGANVSCLDLNPPPTDAIAPEHASRALFSRTDVASTESLQAALKATLQWCQHTSKPLSGTICCAGVGGPAVVLPRQDAGATHDSVKYMDLRGFDRVVGINLRGTVDLIRLTVPHLALNEPWGPDGERGVVIVVASVAAYEGQVGQLAYSASKAGVVGIVLPLARELGARAGIRVNGIAPGLFHTGMTAATPERMAQFTRNSEMVQYPKRAGRGDEFARLVKEMIQNPMINGGVIRLDGAVRMPSRL